MNAKVEQYSIINPNPILSVVKDGTIIYSNKAGEPLLNEWDIDVGKKLPSSIADLVQRVIRRNSPESIEVKAGKKVYLVTFHPFLEEECVNIYGFDISDWKEFKEKFRESESQEMANLELAEIIDTHTIQSLMDDFYKLAHIPMSIDDLENNVLVGVGWQDICTKFHRVNPKTCKHCIESGTMLSAGVPQGEFKLYKCKNNMWHIATPIFVGGQHVGNIFSGQFFFKDEPLDYEFYRYQVKQYGFNEEEYIAALEKVPRLSLTAVDTGISFFIKLGNIISQLSYSNIKLTQSLAERNSLVEALRESEKMYRNIVETANEGIGINDSEFKITYANKRMADMLGYTLEEGIGRSMWDFLSEESKAIVKLNLKKKRLGIDGGYELKFIRKDGSPIWAHMNSKPLLDKEGKYLGSVSMFTDITKRKEAEKALRNIEIARKKEIHHRIKNNLQVISSLLDLQAENFKSKKNIRVSEVLEAFKESQDRVISMALIHEELHKGGGLDTLNFSSYIEELADSLLLTYRLGNESIGLDMDIEEDIFFDMDTSVPLGIIINELISNSLKHAFFGRDKGEIRINLHREENGECETEGCNTAYILNVSDNGVGIPEYLDLEDLDSLGLQLVTALVDQLDGELELKRDTGTEFIMKFTVRRNNDQEYSQLKCN